MTRTPRLNTLALISLSATHMVVAQSYSVATIAGTTTIKDGIAASKAFLRYPVATQADSKGNIYVLDQYDARVRKIDSKGIITTVVGNGIAGLTVTASGPALEASLNGALDLAIDRKGLFLYIADTENYRVLKVDLTTSTITTIGGTGSSKVSGDGGPAILAGIRPDSVTVDDAGNVYTGDSAGARIRKIDASTGIITTFAGNGTPGWSGDTGPANQAEIGDPWSVTTDKQFLYFADPYVNLIRRIDLTSGIITTYAGTGYATCPVRDGYGYCASSGDGGNLDKAGFAGPTYVNANEAGDLLIMDCQSITNIPTGGSLRFIAAGSTVINFIAGGPGLGYSGDGTGGLSNVTFQYPFGVAIAGPNTYLIADSGNYRLREVANFAIQTIAGFRSPDGQPATSTVLNYPTSAAIDAAGNLFIADSQDQRVRKVAASTGLVSTALGTGVDTIDGAGFPYPFGMASGLNSTVYVGNYDHIVQLDSTGNPKIVTGSAGTAGFAGDGTLASGALVKNVNGITTDSKGNVYFADTGNLRVRRIDATTGAISTVAGNGHTSSPGEGVAATSVGIIPYDVAVDTAGNLYISDAGTPSVRQVAAGSGLITTIAGGITGVAGDGGPAVQAGLQFPLGVTVDTGGNVFIADLNAAVIRRVDGKTGIITRVAGTHDNSNPLDTGAALQVSMRPTAVVALADGSLLVSDAGNDRIRKLTLQTPKTILISSGNNQTGATGASLTIAAQVLDAAGFPVANVPVTFAAAAGTAQPTPATVMSIGDGTATTSVALGQTAGPITVTATVDGITPITFTLNVIPPFINTTNGVTGLPMSNPPSMALAQNGLMQISGQGFLAAGTPAGVVGDGDLVNGELPTVYNTVCVTLSGTPAPILAASPTQIIFQVPVLQPGTADVSVTTACGTGSDLPSPVVTLPVQSEAPEFFYVQQNLDGTSLVGVMNNGTSLPALTSLPGDSVSVFLTGLGTTNPVINPGDVVAADDNVDATVTIQLGAETITPDWVTTPANLPGAPYVTQIGENAGLYLIQFTIPADAPAGNLPLTVTTSNGFTSPLTAYMAIAAPPSSGAQMKALEVSGATAQPQPGVKAAASAGNCAPSIQTQTAPNARSHAKTSSANRSHCF